MKKILLFLAVFIFLAGLGWGQAEFTWTGGGGNTDWDDKDNWEDELGNSVADYPGSSKTDDIVIINGATVTISSAITLGKLEISNSISTDPHLVINASLSVTDFILDDTLQITGTPGVLSVENITLNTNGGTNGTGRIEMNGSTVQVPNNTDTLTINPVNGNLGKINANNRNVTLNIPSSGNVTISDISATGNISINVGNNGDVDAGDISSDGNITINVGTGGKIDIYDIHANGTISFTGAGVVNVTNYSGDFQWVGTTSTVWTIGTNWVGGASPGDGTSSSKIIIHPSSRDPVFTGTALECATLEIKSGASLNMGADSLTVATLENNGNLILAGSGTQEVKITTVTANEMVTYNASGTHFAGLTNFTNLEIKNGTRTGVGAITVGGDFTLSGGSLTAISINVTTGTSDIRGIVTTSGNQTYGAVTLSDNVTLAGTTVTLGAIDKATHSLTITGDSVLNGDASGTGALSVSATGSKTVKLGANITLQGTTVTLGTIDGDGKSLTITGDGTLHGGDDIVDLIVSGTATINGSITTTGTQTYAGDVTLGGNVTLKGTTVTTGIINGTTHALEIDGNGVLNGGGSDIGALSVTEDFRLVSGTLSAASVVITGTSNVAGDVTTTGAQTYDMAVTLSGAKRTITSDSGNILFSSTLSVTDATNDKIELVATGGAITVDDKITANQLIARASGTVKVSAIEIINNTGNEGEGAAIYIEATNFITTSGKTIVPGSNVGAQWGQLCLVLKNHWTDTNGVVDGSEDPNPDSLSSTGYRWHQHYIDLTKDLVYGDGTVPNGLVSGTYTRVYNNNTETSFTLAAGKNIYIYNAKITPQNTSGLTFVTSGTGSIKFLGNNEFSSITLTTGSGGVILADTEITVTTGGFVLAAGTGTTLTDNSGAGSKITAANITLNSVTTADDKTLTLISTGNVTLSGVIYAKSIDVTSTTTTIGANIDTTGGTQTYGAVTLSGTNQIHTLTGTTVTIGAVTGSGNSLTISGNGELNGDVSGINALSVSGTVTLSGTNQIHTLTGTAVTLGTIDGKGKSLTITGNGTFNGGGTNIGALSVSGTFNLASGSLSAASVAANTATGTSTIAGDITTTGGAQTYTGAVTLGGTNALITLQGTTVTMGTIAGAGKSLTITGNGVLSGGSVIGDLLVSGTSTINANITTTGTQTYIGAVTLGGAVTLAGTTVTMGTINGATHALIINGDITLNGGGANIGALTVNGDFSLSNGALSTASVAVNTAKTSSIASDITTTGTQTYGAVTLTGTITLTTGTAGNVTATSVTGGNLTVNAGGDITLVSIAGGTFELNAGYPDHTVFGIPGTVTLTDIDVTDLIIWCEEVTSSGMTNKAARNVELNTDDDAVKGVDFLDSFIVINNQINELRPHSFEFAPANPNNNHTWIDSNDANNWDTIIPTSPGRAYIYITGNITVPVGVTSGNLTIKTESGNIVFNGTYNATGHSLTLETTTGKIEQPTAGSIITVDNLTINAGNTVTLAQNNAVKELTVVSPAGNVEFKNNSALEISGINAGANSVKLTVTGDIDLSGSISASSINIDAGSITGNGTATASTGDISFDNSVAGAKSVSLSRFNAPYGNIIVSTTAKDIVYYSATPPVAPPSGAWTTPLFVEANSTYNRNVILRTQGTNSNIYLVDVVDSSQKTLTVDAHAGTGINGFIEFFTTSANSYTYTGTNPNHLDLLPGAGGVRIVKSVVDISVDFKINNTNNKLTLGGSGTSSIKAKNIILGDITATTATIELEASGNITISGSVTAAQLIAKAPNGTVTVNAITIDSSNTGNEGENAAIYIEANTFVVSTTTANSIKPGGTGGQLCLVIRNKWTDTNGVVDGDEDPDPDNPTAAYRWHQHLPPVVINGRILYSFTEDSNGNGRLDRIRVQTNVQLTGNFTGFTVDVEGYTVSGFGMVSNVTGKPADNDSFYIYLTEGVENDGGNTPFWSVAGNTTLANTAGGSLVGNPAVDINIKPVDTIPPRVAYTLTIPGHPQTYVQMSEQVVSSSGADISVTFGGSLTVQNMSRAEPAGLGYLFDLSGSLTVEELAKDYNSLTLEDGYLQMDDAVDNGVEPGLIDGIQPKYPLDWGYSEYADNTNTNALIPPNKLSGPEIRRVTDVLVSRAPEKTDSDNYFAWPVWARFKKSLNAPYAADNDVFWGQQPTDTGIIWQFDGSNYLETSFIDSNEGLELQARINDNLSADPVLFWTTSNVPAEYRNPQEATEDKKIGGLWLPNIPAILYNFVALSDGINGKAADGSSSKLFNYDLPANGLVAENGAKFEFIFRLSSVSDMFIARLDIPRGGVIPADWYALLRPFVFEIRNIRRQRGGVTVMNNVINSNNRETAFIRYHLTRPGRVTVQVYTLDGTLVKSLRRNEQRAAGEWTDSWDGTNNGGRAVARGMYFVRVVGPDIDEIRKIMVIK